MPAQSTTTRVWLLSIFVLSGFSGLIYQSIWSHYLGLFLGHAAYAQALVLAIFMGGMAAGAALVARAGEKWRNLVRWYALAEAVIGLLGLGFHWLFTSVLDISYSTILPALGGSWAAVGMRWVIAAALILPQTILLGMTFPLMSGGIIRRFPGQSGIVLGGLYFTNSIGAALGALVSVFVLLPWGGLPGAIATAGALNLLVAALAAWLAREPEPVKAIDHGAETSFDKSLAHNPILRVVLASTALSGAASFGYEIVWVRMLGMVVGSTLHAFELMLAAFIAGIAFGGLWIRRRCDQSKDPLRLAGWMQIWMGVAALASLGVYAASFDGVAWLIGALARSSGGYSLYNLGTAVVAMLVMLPAAFFAGTTLPLFTVALLRSGAGENAIGRVYAWNTLGSIAGVFVTVHLLIPALGLKLSLWFAALVDLSIGLMLIRRQSSEPADSRRFVAAACVAGVALALGGQTQLDLLKMSSGVYRTGVAVFDPKLNYELIYFRDGKTSSVSVVGNEEGRFIATNGKTDASIAMDDKFFPTPDESTMVLASLLPLAMLDAPKRVGIIGFGSGLSTHTALGDPRVEQVDTIEIEQAMVDGAKAFGPRVVRAYTDPRSKIVIDDAKAYFAGQSQKYDIIISEPSNPWISGVGSLFSKEFYVEVSRYISDDGLFVQWVQTYESNDKVINSVLKSLVPAFEDYAAWSPNDTDLLIVAKPKGKLSPIDLSRLNGATALHPELHRLELNSDFRLNTRKVADARVLRALARLHPEIPPNSDYSHYLSLHAPRARFIGDSADLVQSLGFSNASLLEALGIRPPPPMLDTPIQKTVMFDQMIRTAREFARQLRGEQPVGTPNLILLKSTLGDCKAGSSAIDPRVFSTSVIRLAAETLPMLSPAEAEGVWIRPQWLKCPEKLPAEYQRALRLVEARAQRDYDAIEKLSRSWLTDKSPDSALQAGFEPFALEGLLLALARAERWEEARATLDQYDHLIPPTASQKALRELLRGFKSNP